MSGLWFTEQSFAKQYGMSFKVTEVLHREQTPYQLIEVFETSCVGRLLTLDGKTMISQKDEFVYHEVMAHIPYMVHPSVNNVLIIGGGDGGVVREFARHKGIQRIDLVEIDRRVIEVSREFFPQCTSALDDPRVSIHAQDGLEFIAQKNNFYDIIVIDSTDPENFASSLFTETFYRDVHQALTERGIMMNQTENPFFDEYGIASIYKNMRKVFPKVYSFSAPMVIYPGVFWTFGFSSKSLEATNIQQNKRQEIKALESQLQWYNPQWHEGAFALSNFHRRAIGLDC